MVSVVGDGDEIEYSLRTFEVIGILGILSVAQSYFIASATKEIQQRDAARKQRDVITQELRQLIQNNPSAMTPRFDSHIIDITIGLLALLFAGYIEDASHWVEQLGSRVVYAYHIGRHFPIASDSFDDLIALAVGQSLPKESLMVLSTLIPILAEWNVVVNLPSYTDFQRAVVNTFTATDLQIWYPDTITDTFLYQKNAAFTSGATLTTIQLPDSLEALRERLLHLRDAYNTFASLSCVEKGWSIIGIVASRHFRTPIIPAYWQDQIDDISYYCFNKERRQMTKTNRILIIVTNADEYEKVGYRTGLWLGELTHFWDVLEAAGYEMDIASPLGGKIPIDPISLLKTELEDAVGLRAAVSKRYEDRAFMNRLHTTKKILDVNSTAYDAIYMTGGHGVMFDFPHATALAELTAHFYEANKIVSAVCHGPCGLLEVKRSNGDYLITGKNVTGFSWKEEVLAKRDQAVPFSLEEELQKRGAIYSKARLPFVPHVVEDGLLITGQNPTSPKAVAQAVVKKLQAMP